MNYLLDTHASIWFFEDSPKLPKRVWDTVTQPENVAIEGGTVTFDVKSNTDWKAEVEPSKTWLSITESDANGNGDKTVTVTVEANTGAQRTAAITVKTLDGKQTKVANLTQLGTEAPSLNATTPAAVNADATSVKFNITANVEWEISEEVEWITNVNPATGTGNAEVTVTLTANTGDEQRQGTIVVAQKGGELSRNVIITQNGVGGPTVSILGTWNYAGYDFFNAEDVAWTGVVSDDNGRYLLDKMPFDIGGPQSHKLIFEDAGVTDLYIMNALSESVGTLVFQGTTYNITQAPGAYLPGGEGDGVWLIDIGQPGLEFEVVGNTWVLPEFISMNTSEHGVIDCTPCFASLVSAGIVAAYGDLEITKGGAAPMNIVTEKGKKLDLTNCECTWVPFLK